MTAGRRLCHSFPSSSLCHIALPGPACTKGALLMRSAHHPIQLTGSPKVSWCLPRHGRAKQRRHDVDGDDGQKWVPRLSLSPLTGTVCFMEARSFPREGEAMLRILGKA